MTTGFLEGVLRGFVWTEVLGGGFDVRGTAFEVRAIPREVRGTFLKVLVKLEVRGTAFDVRAIPREVRRTQPLVLASTNFIEKRQARRLVSSN